MKVKSIPSSWIARDGLRLDCNPYMSGALEARIRLEELPYPKDTLVSLCSNGIDGIYHAGRESRSWVEDPDLGVPFLSSSSILSADLSGLPLISKKQVKRNPKFLLKKGWTLITRSGTIGRMVYARPDMEGLACSEHVMRVVPDETKIPPGYLYAFLSSKFGVPLVTSGTYGSIIQSIEPEHIAGLPVPRLGEIEEEVNLLVEDAASLRTRASQILLSAVHELENQSNLDKLTPPSSPTPFSCVSVRSTTVQERFDAFFHSPYGNQVVEQLKAGMNDTTTIGELALTIVEPNRFKRIRVDDPNHGVRFFGTSALMWSEPIEMYFLPKGQQGMHQYIVTEQTVLIPRSGQLSGIIGSAVLPYGGILGSAVSEDAIRINCGDSTTAGYVFVALSSQYGLRQLKARAYGSSIPHLDVHQIGRVVVPDLGAEGRCRIGELGSKVSQLRNTAVEKEREARTIVERAIEEAP
jgi:type I restriction enzyme S subunit